MDEKTRELAERIKAQAAQGMMESGVPLEVTTGDADADTPLGQLGDMTVTEAQPYYTPEQMSRLDAWAEAHDLTRDTWTVREAHQATGEAPAPHPVAPLDD